jgi:LysM repeat protein
MKWKDTGGSKADNPDKSDPYYDDDGYASFKEKGSTKAAIFSGSRVRYLYWGVGIAGAVGVVLLATLLFSNISGPGDLARISDLEQRIERLEHRLEKVDGVDEKVTHIWEQAKSFETFKTRFDRSEASMSLRMDHLAMSLDALQKKTDETLNKIEGLGERAAPPATPASPPPAKKAATAKTHTVVAGDTLFSISRRYKLSVEQLRSINQLDDQAMIHVGQTLRVNAPDN